MSISKTSTTIREATLWGRQRLMERGIPNVELDTRVLLGESSGLDHSQILAYPDEVLSNEAFTLYESLIKRRLNREPISSILGKKEFWSLPFTVSHDTLTPRPETETLVTHVIDFLREHPEGKRRIKVLDIGTGSGNIPVAIASEVEDVVVFATDLSFKALLVARGNTSKFNLSERIHLVNGDLLDHFKGGLDLIVSNPPYIRASDLPSLSSEITDYEPGNALDGGADGLLFYREIISGSLERLNSNGGIFFEVGHDQAESVEEMLLNSGIFKATSIFKDLSGIPRVVSGTKR